MMIQLLVRYRDPADERPRVGLLRDGRLYAIADVGSMSALLTRTVGELRQACEQAVLAEPIASDDVQLLAPVDGHTEVWAAGVTYRRSVQARVLESEHTPDVYDRVYQAERPEIFFKSTAWRVVASGQPVAIRADSAVNVPEPELAVVINAHGEVVGYTVGNDMSSRTIEGENPLYLPQAKVYLGSCALGPGIRPAWELTDPYALRIGMTIDRDGASAWSGEASTEELQRPIDELATYLWRADEFPHGVVLCTGTCLVPDLPFTLEPGDRVRIDISGIGTLENPVVRGKAAMSWLTGNG
jgi:2-dehydro-3-deoxy-D-arabinonate dehydratase